MVTQQFKTFGLTFNLSVPSTTEEFDQNAKKTGSCLAEAIKNVVYRGTLAEAREKVCEAVESAFGIARKTKETGKFKEVKDATTGVVTKEAILAYDEKEEAFIDRCISEKGLDKATALQPIVDAVASTLVFDASATERKSDAPKKLAAKYATAATAIMAKDGAVAGFNAKANKALGKTFTATGDTAKDTEVLGRLVKEFVEYNEAQQILKLTA